MTVNTNHLHVIIIEVDSPGSKKMIGKILGILMKDLCMEIA